MRLFFHGCLIALMWQPAFARPRDDVYRPVSFICRDGATGTSVRIEENVLGHRKSYEVSYFDGRPTLFVISESRNGRPFRRIALIDLRSDTDHDRVEAATYLTAIMVRDAARFCKGSRRAVLAARYELQTNHFFNRAHPRYRGK